MLIFRKALVALANENTTHRMEQVQMLMSDPRTEPLDALDRKSAYGAYNNEAR
jgi:hypothetical protein